MSQEAISAQGTILYRQALGAGPFVEIGELRDMSGPALTRNPIETTSHNEEEETFVVGIRRKGELTAQIGYVPDGGVDTNHDLLEAAWRTGSRDVWKVEFPTSPVKKSWLFSGFVTNLGPSMPVDDGLVADLTIRPTGVMTFDY